MTKLSRETILGKVEEDLDYYGLTRPEVNIMLNDLKLGVITPRQRIGINLRLGGLTFGEAGEKMGVTASRAKQHWNGGMTKLRRTKKVVDP